MATPIDDQAIGETIEAEVRQTVSGASGALTIASLEPSVTPEATRIEAACERVGIALRRVKCSAASIHERIAEANNDPAVSGILVNGLRAGADPDHWRDRIDPRKDIAGSGPMNAGLALMGKSRIVPVEALWPAIAAEASGIDLWGARATVLGHGDFLSRTLAMILIDKRATTTYVDIRNASSVDLSEANVVFAATGKRKVIAAGDLKENCILIEICVGDVDESAREIAGSFLCAPEPASPIAVALMLQNCAQTSS